jgi:hypothetical protein
MNQGGSKAISPAPSAAIPAGFPPIIGPDGQQCIVPEYLIPATHQAFDAYRKRVELDVNNEQGGVCIHFQLGTVGAGIDADADADADADWCPFNQSCFSQIYISSSLEMMSG